MSVCLVQQESAAEERGDKRREEGTAVGRGERLEGLSASARCLLQEEGAAGADQVLPVATVVVVLVHGVMESVPSCVLAA